MASNKEKTEVKEMIQSLYILANVHPVWNGDVNERVAEVFGLMLNETKKCSSAFKSVPRPPGGRASIVWLVTQLGRGIFSHHRSRISITCARSVIYKWNRELEMASMGLVVTRLPTWA